MPAQSKLLACLSGVVAATSLAATGANAQCVFMPALTTQTTCVTAISIPGSPLRSFDISFVNPKRAEYYFADRSNAAVQVIDTQGLKWKRSLGGFVGIRNNPNGTVNNNISGPDGVTSHGRWVYAGDGDSTLKVFDLDAPPAAALKQVIPTGGQTRVDEMALSSNGKLLLAANNAEDPPFATLFTANGNADKSSVSIISRITVNNAIMPAGFGLSIEQPTWDPGTKRFYTSLPVTANNPAGCNYGQLPTPANPGPITCDGGVLVVDPYAITTPAVTLGLLRSGDEDRRDRAARLRAERIHARAERKYPARLHAAEQSERRDHAGAQRGEQDADPRRQHHRVRRGLVQRRRQPLLHWIQSQLRGLGISLPSSEPAKGRAWRDRRSDEHVDRDRAAILQLAFGGGRLQAQSDFCPAGRAGCDRRNGRRHHDRGCRHLRQ